MEASARWTAPAAKNGTSASEWSELHLYCSSPQENPGAAGADLEPAVMEQQAKKRAADRAALRWEANCTFQKQTSRHRAPRFVRLDSSADAYWRRDWFIRGVARELLTEAPMMNLPEGWRGPPGLRPSVWPKDVFIRAGVAPSNVESRHSVENLVDGNAGTAWCATEGRPYLELRFPSPESFFGIALLPGLVKSDWLYEANAAPRVVRVVARSKDARIEQQFRLELPDSAELFAQGRDALFVPLKGTAVEELTLTLEGVRPGLFSPDNCISELWLVR